MRKIFGFGVVLAAAYFTGTMGVAYGQPAGTPAVPNATAREAINTVAPGATATPGQSAGAGANTRAPGNVQAPGTAGTVLNQAGATGASPATAAPGATATPGQSAGVGANTRAPGNVQAPGTAGTALNQAGVTGTTPATAAPGTVNPGTTYMPVVAVPAGGTYPGTATAATPGYTGRVMPGMTGYNSVNPMSTTMAPGYYYAGTAGTPYATYSTPRYTTPGNYSTQPYVVQRRGLFGRRNRIVYPASPYGYTTYSNAPSGYTTYGTTTYYSTPGAYSYGPTYASPRTYTNPY